MLNLIIIVNTTVSSFILNYNQFALDCLEALVHPFSLAFMRLSRVIMLHLVWRLRWTLVWTCTMQISVRHVSSGLVKWDVSVALRTLNQDTVISRANYCNSVRASVPKKVTDNLQRVQNPAARLITGTQKHSCCMVTCTGWLYHSVIIHQCLQYQVPKYTPTVAGQSLKFPAANIFIRLAIANRIFHGVVAAQLAPGLSQSSVRRFGTRCVAWSSRRVSAF